MHSKENKKYWEDCNVNYSKVWEPRGRQEMSKRELNYIKNSLTRFKPTRILDVGVGNGRILECLVRFSSKKAQIFGIDISNEMVKICKKKFKDDKKVKKIIVCDLATEKLPFSDEFDFITMIRVLKYNQNWPEILHKTYDGLSPGGILIFTMPNKVSISFFSGDTFSEKKIPIRYSSKNELRSILSKNNFKSIDFISFSKLPNFLYHLSQNQIYIKFLLFSEKALEILFGKSFLGRELFVVCRK